MFPRKVKVAAAIAAPLVVLSLGAVGTAQALTVHDAPVQAASATGPKQDKYTDQDVVGLLALASGRAAQDHPDVAAKFKVEGAPTATDEQIGQLTDALVSVDPNFHSSVTHAVQANDPYQAQKGIDTISADLKTLATQSGASESGGDVHTDGFFYHDSNIAVEINVAGVLNAVGYANVAAATEVGVVLYVVPDAISYGFDLNRKGDFERTETAALVTSAL